MKPIETQQFGLLLPLAGEGGDEGAARAPTLTPTLSRKRERECFRR